MPGRLSPESDFLSGIEITPDCFSCAYVYPGENEYEFVRRVTPLLVPFGILVLSCPIVHLCGNSKLLHHLETWFKTCITCLWPWDHRDNGEITVFATKLPTKHECRIGPKSDSPWRNWWYSYEIASLERSLAELGDRKLSITLPPGRHPTTFRKTAYTPQELLRAMQDSPLASVPEDVPTGLLERPPLPLGAGHVGLMLAAGQLQGVVHTATGSHVVRGGCWKEEVADEEASSETRDSETGRVKMVDAYFQRPVMAVRVLDESGKIRTFSDSRG
jgi:hypothetical protein